MAVLNKLQGLIATVAPILGTALGGPLGGAVVGILADQFGVANDPVAVHDAIKSSDPEVIKANLARAEAAFKAEAEKAVTVRQQIQSHVEMMRMDYDRGGFHSLWRPLAGWLAVLFSASTCFITVKDAWFGQYALLAQAPSILMIGGPLMALAGIYAWGKSEERKAMVNSGGSLQEAIGSLLKR